MSLEREKDRWVDIQKDNKEIDRDKQREKEREIERGGRTWSNKIKQ